MIGLSRQTESSGIEQTLTNHLCRRRNILTKYTKYNILYYILYGILFYQAMGVIVFRTSIKKNYWNYIPTPKKRYHIANFELKKRFI